MGNAALFSALKLNLACRDTVLYYSIRPKAGPGIALKGDGIEDGIPVQPQDESLLGQIDGLEAGIVSGWACSRGQLLKPLEVSFPILGSLIVGGKALVSTPTSACVPDPEACRFEIQCINAASAMVLQVEIYVDGVKVGQATASGETPHHIVHRMCELDLHFSTEMEQPALQQGVGFKLELPDLSKGKHEVRSPAPTIVLLGAQSPLLTSPALL